MTFQVMRRAGNFAVARPAREVLFTVVAPTDRYKAKTFIDTVVYRVGDQLGAWAFALLGAMGAGVAGISGDRGGPGRAVGGERDLAGPQDAGAVGRRAPCPPISTSRRRRSNAPLPGLSSGEALPHAHVGSQGGLQIIRETARSSDRQIGSEPITRSTDQEMP